MHKSFVMHSAKRAVACAAVAVFTMCVGWKVHADEAQAKQLFKAMSDYMAAQQAISFNFDTSFEVITKQDQKIAFASSGTVTLNRPDKIRATRAGGFANV